MNREKPRFHVCAHIAENVFLFIFSTEYTRDIYLSVPEIIIVIVVDGADVIIYTYVYKRI